MAYLNVRERRLETKIAYIGAEFSGRATNFLVLGKAASPPPVGEGGSAVDDLSLFWKPRVETSFRDCDVRVELVTSHGEPSSEEILGLVRSADGVVFVADADPSAQDRNRLSLALVREALSAQVDREVPVVVQVNKTDLPDALGEEALAVLLGLGDWTRVMACATRGEGVVETVEEALAKVLEVLRQDASAASATSGGPRQTIRPASVHALPREGNPLLTALRQVLRETVHAEIEALDERTAVRLDRLFDERADREQLQLAAAAAATKASTEALLAAVRETRAELAAQKTELVALREQVAAEGAKAQLVASTATAIKRAVEILGADVKASDPRTLLTPMKAALDAVVLQMASLTALVKPVNALAPQIEEAEGRLKKEIMGRGALMVKTLETKHEENAATLAKLDTKHTELTTLFETVIEELKKPKKSWFT